MFAMDIVCDVVPAKRIKSCRDYSSVNDILPVYNLKYEERDLQEIVVDTEVSIYVCKTLISPYNLHCLLCNKTCSDESSVYSHMNSPKHFIQLWKKKEAIGIISKEFNTFILCCLSDLIAFVHIYYKTHGLNEIVVANREFIFSENTDHYSGDSETSNKIIVSSPRFIPPIVENSVYFRIVVDREDSQLYYESRAARYSNLTGNIVIETRGSCSPKIAYIYELFDKGIPSSGPLFVDILEWCSENIPPSTIVWCSLCSKSVSIQCLPYHLNQEHICIYHQFLYALMCHKCETLFLFLYGEKMHHVHNKGATKKILRNQSNKKFNAVHLMPDISAEAIEIYMNDFIKRYSKKKSHFKFECLLCFSPLVECFDEFANHLRDPSHLDNVVHESRKFTAFCDSCDIVFIAQNVNRLFDHFEVHNFSLKVIENVEDSAMTTSDTGVTIETGSNYSAESTIIYPKVANFSESAFQFTNPGVQDDFTITRDMTIENIEEYIEETFYSIYSDLKKIYFVCLNCTSSRMDKSSFYNHLKNRKHLMKVRPFSDLIFFVKICDICQIFLLGSHIELVEKHFTSTDHNQNVKCRMEFIKQQYVENSGKLKLGWSGKLTDRSVELFSYKEALNNHIESCLKEAEEISKSASFIHGMLERDIRKTLEPICGHTDIKFFGSRTYGLAGKNSDVDIFINGATIEDLEQGFSKSMSLFCVKEAIKEAKVPIIKVEHIYTSLDCDINCCDNGAVYNSELIKVYIALDPRVKWLLMAVKEWASVNYIKGSQKFTSYGLIWLLLFFLMQPDICLVPPVNLLKSLYNGPKTLINGWNYSFSSDIETIKVHHNPLACKKTKYELLLHFFQYYAILKAKRVVLFPLSGEVYSRSVLANTDMCICPELSMNTEDAEPVRIGGQFVLLDCFRLRYNLLKNVEENLADHFKLICAKMYENSSWRS